MLNFSFFNLEIPITNKDGEQYDRIIIKMGLDALRVLFNH